MNRVSSMEKTIEILLVEDNAADVELARQGLMECDVSCNLSVARTGEQALALLRREGNCANAPRPDLILLDLNLPGISGRDVLAAIKNDDKTCDIPVIILTNSDADKDIRETYRLYVNSYIQKPVDFDQFVEIARGISNYWFTLVRLPPRD